MGILGRRARVTDRAGWVRANIASFSRLLRPLTDKLGERMGDAKFSSVAGRATGAELGLLLGWMSTRVLGQYDQPVAPRSNVTGLLASPVIVYWNIDKN